MFTSGTEFPEDVSGYKLIVHCGGCMLNAREMKSRLRSAARSGDPDDQLWDFDCLYEGNFETEHGGTGAGQVGNLGGEMNRKSVNN